MRRLLSLALAIIAGLAFWAAFPDVRIWPLALVGCALLWGALELNDSVGWNLLLGFITGAVFFGPHVWWASIATAFVPWIALVLLQAAYFAAFGALWTLTRRLCRGLFWHKETRPSPFNYDTVFPARHGAPLLEALAFAILYTGVEQWRSATPFGGFPWGRLAWTVAGYPLGRAAWLGGTVFVTFLLVLAAMLLVAALRAILRHNSVVRETEIGFRNQIRNQVLKQVLAPLLAAIFILFGPLLLPLPHDQNVRAVSDPPVTTLVDPGDRLPWVNAGTETAQDGILRVGIAQGDVPERGAAPEVNAVGVFENHLLQTEKLATDSAQRNIEGIDPAGFDVIVWPENAAAWDPMLWPTVAAPLNVAAEQANAPILVGTMEYPPDGRYNVMLLWEEGYGVISRYAKQRPAPFGEYIPMRRFARLVTDQVDRLPVDMLAGDNPPLIDVPLRGVGTDRLTGPIALGESFARLGVGICFEVAYDEIFIDAARLGAQVLIVPTNNASFGVTPQSTQQLQMTQLQAITTGRAAVQISTVGVSGVFTPDGTLVARTGLYVPDRISALMPLRSTWTPAVALGMIPSHIFQALAIILPVFALLTTRSNPNHSPLTQITPAAPPRPRRRAITYRSCKKKSFP
ncbi:MAG: apolipoprotein N-acyltransferase [Cellulomonadaceae bacterium]|jgi:apolipoprotein N-acyltransferase|nr:apolipoprotein N-acyltransferase [Cellulomonadaceae bacterium]